MSAQICKVLLVESDEWNARLVQEALSELLERQEALPVRQSFPLDHAACLEEGLQLLIGERYDVVLLNPMLSDSLGLESFFALHSQAPGIPVIILSERKDELLAASAVREGAVDYLLIEEVDCLILARRIRHAVQQHQLLATLREHAFFDPATGLLSRLGFLTLAAHHVTLAGRLNARIRLLVAKAENPHPFADAFERQVKDMALMDAAENLRRAFPEPDLAARLSGNCFAVLKWVWDRSGNAEADTAKMLGALAAADQPIFTRTGAAELEGGEGTDIASLVESAEKRLCENRRKDLQFAV